MKYILILALLLPSSESEEPYLFVNDCLDIFVKLDSATTKFENIVRSEKDRQILNKEIKLYVDDLVMYSMNRLSKYNKSEDQLIKDVSTDLNNVLTNLVKMNYQYLNFVTNVKSTNKELIAKGEESLVNLREESRKFIDISTGICMITADQTKRPSNCKQFLRITLEQSQVLNNKMEAAFTLLETQNKHESTHFEKSTAIIYDFLSMNSEYSDN